MNERKKRKEFIEEFSNNSNSKKNEKKYSSGWRDEKKKNSRNQLVFRRNAFSCVSEERLVISLREYAMNFYGYPVKNEIAKKLLMV